MHSDIRFLTITKLVLSKPKLEFNTNINDITFYENLRISNYNDLDL